MSTFPKNFKFGVSTSAFQIEGGWLKDGKGLSIWDAYNHTPGKIFNDENADTACDHINRFEKDVELLKYLGVNAYRFSISWSRVLPQGIGMINENGIDFYSNLIDLLAENKIEPWITLNHFDLPLTLQMEKDGWLNPDIADYFTEYAELCFSRFGKKVKNWITFNEPWVVALLGNGKGEFAPGRPSDTELYTVGHNILRAHAHAVNSYNENFRADQNGLICMANNCDWKEPKTNSAEDIAAANRSLEFQLGWFADPLYFGDYPKSMKDALGARLPEFSVMESEMLINSVDFFAINHYTSHYAENIDQLTDNMKSYEEGLLDVAERVLLSTDPNWKKTAFDWSIAPWGFGKLLRWISQRYDAPEIYVTENGAAFNDEKHDNSINDIDRIDYLKKYTDEMKNTLNEGVKIKGYFIWSLLDNFEWVHGYSKRFGLFYTDFDTMERTPKASAKWYKEFIQENLK